MKQPQRLSISSERILSESHSFIPQNITCLSNITGILVYKPGYTDLENDNNTTPNNVDTNYDNGRILM